MPILGVHDAHDAGAAMVSYGNVLGAVNEERWTKLKNDVGFPTNSIKYLLGTGDEADKVAIPWIGGSALFARIFPGMEVQRRRLWRREVKKPSVTTMKLRNIAFKIIQEQEPEWLWRSVGRAVGGLALSQSLRRMNLRDRSIVFVEHHVAHAAAAYYASGFKEALVITLDGAGDGLCGSVSVGDNGELKRINSFKAGNSIGIFYGAATMACDMRYSEDEGKLMSLAAYSYPQEIPELERLVHYDTRRRKLTSMSGIKYELLLAEWMKDNILWRYPREAFAYAVQRHVERQVTKLVDQYIKETGIRNIAVAGGFFSNIIVNMLINERPDVKNFFVFPHMGDGGLALGAAYAVDWVETGRFNPKQIDNFYFGPAYTDNQIEDVLKKYKKRGFIDYDEKSDIASYAADQLTDRNRTILWFQGRMEYGPRALGNRSVLTLPNDHSHRDEINLIIKRRPYYQPFASSILEEDAPRIMDPYPRGNKFMTVGYKVKPEHMADVVAAAHIDGTTRPQTLGGENEVYRNLLKRIKRKTGFGALLNTSLNKHGRPIVMNPDDAVWTLLNTGATCLGIGNFWVERKRKSGGV